MNEETREFLLECKKVGYEFVTICVKDKRVPITLKIEKFGERKYSNFPSFGEYWGEITITEENGEKFITNPCKVVAAAPNRRETGRPALWTICEQSTLTAGMEFRGFGLGESHEIRRGHPLEKGCYDLKEIN